MGENPSIVEQAANEMDEMLADVMPDSWMGHARIRANEENLSEKQTDFFLKLCERMAEKKDRPVTELTEACLKATREKV